MRLFGYFRSVSGKLFHRGELAEDMEEELRSHIALRAEDLERSGMSRADAERRARIEFGGQEKYKDESYEAMGGNFVETLIQDVRVSLRMLLKSPGFATVAVLTLALAIGANAVVFGILNALVLRPLHVPHAESLWGIERGPDNAINHSYPDYRDLRERNHSFTDLAAYNVTGVGFDPGNSLHRACGFSRRRKIISMSWACSPSWGLPVTPKMKAAPTAHPTSCSPTLSGTRTFITIPGAVGRVVQVNRHPFTILGVAPPEFRGTLGVWLS